MTTGREGCFMRDRQGGAERGGRDRREERREEEGRAEERIEGRREIEKMRGGESKKIRTGAK